MFEMCVCVCVCLFRKCEGRVGKREGISVGHLATQRGQVPSAVNKVLLLRKIVNLLDFNVKIILL